MSLLLGVEAAAARRAVRGQSSHTSMSCTPTLRAPHRSKAGDELQFWGDAFRGMFCLSACQKYIFHAMLEGAGAKLKLDPVPEFIPFLTRARSDRTRGNGFEMTEGRFRLDKKKKLFIVRVVEHWQRLPREIGDAPSLGVY